MVLSLSRRAAQGLRFLVSYTFSKAEDTSADFQSSAIPEVTGLGRDPNDPTGLPLGFDPRLEKGPSLQDQRHRFVLSGDYTTYGDVNVAAIVTAASGRPYNILAGADLNGDGNGGSFPPDRARTDPADPSTSITRNSGTLPAQAVVDLRVSKRFDLGGGLSLDGIFEVFNLFNRTDFTDVNNVFGTGAYPSDPLPAYGQFLRAAPPRQVQLALKFGF
jgi:outer membrane receptor for Fe3+-dicitrate